MKLTTYDAGLGDCSREGCDNQTSNGFEHKLKTVTFMFRACPDCRRHFDVGIEYEDGVPYITFFHKPSPLSFMGGC